MRTTMLLLALAGVAPALPAADAPYVPPDLEPWVEWVLEDAEAFRCPFAAERDPSDPGSRICAWPGALEIEVEGNGARFRQRWTTYADQFVELPGSLASWPQEVTVNGTAAPVVGGNRNAPRVWLPAGEHSLAGGFTWTARPASLRIPPVVGIVRLTVDGAAVEQAQRNGDGLWLGPRPREAQAAPETIGVRVYRLLSDGLPKILETRLELEVAGRSREVILGRLLPAGFAPVRLASELPARIDPDGRLRLQVRAGRWDLYFAARATAPADTVTLDPGDGPWAAEEIWSWRGDPSLRITEPRAPARVDPIEARVPAAWRSLPAFRLTPGDTLSIEERARADQAAGDNELSLVRRLWLDFDRGGWTAVDEIRGTMRRDWRLDMRAPWSLAAAYADGRSLLITAGAAEGASGVELRNPSVVLRAVARLDDPAARQPATGWETAFQSLMASVTLPPGHLLLHAGGADRAHGTWLSRWQLMDFFLLLLIVVAVARLYGLGYGGLSLAMLALTWQEGYAPHWPWLAALAAIALARVAPEGRLRLAALALRAAALIVLALTLLPWAGQQARLVLYPQLDIGTRSAALDITDWTARRGDNAAGASPQPDAGPGAMTVKVTAGRLESAGRGSAEPGSRMAEPAPPPADEAAPDTLTQARLPDSAGRDGAGVGLSPYAPDALVQAGPGIPAWSGPSYRLDWSGRVSPGDELRLIVIGELGYRVIRLLGVLLAGALLLRLGREAAGGLRTGLPRAAGVLPLLAAAALVFPPNEAGAAGGLPDEPLLRELRQRLLASPPCAPSCAEASAVAVELNETVLRIELTVHAAADVAVPLPWSEGWQPATLTIDGRLLQELQRDENGVPRARVPPGIHRLELAGPVPPVNELRLAFPLPPRRAAVTAPGWEVGGLQNDRLAGDSLQLTRRLAPDAARETGLEPSRFPAFVRVTRRLWLDVDWRMDTIVERVAPAQAPFSVRIPLVPGESPRLGDADENSRLEVVDGHVRGALGLGVGALQWTSDLPATATLTLTAPADLSREEVWEVTTASMWRVGFDGTPALPVPDMAEARGTWVARFRPRPGERLTIRAEPVIGVEGDTLAIDRATLAVEPGRRATASELSLSYRSTRGGRHTIGLPADARVTSVRADGRELNLRPDDGRLSLPVVPGEHSFEIGWEQDTDGRIRVRTPAVDLGANTANVTQRIHVGDGRWTLFASGPGQGPAILYWSELALFLVIAMLLGRTRLAPLGTREWLLLGLGFSTFAWGVLLLVAAWLFATGWRARGRMPDDNLRYNALQAGYGVLTAVTVLALVTSVPLALLGNPQMHVAGPGSDARTLSWFVDRVSGELASATLVSVPLWVYQAAILLWALWLAFAVIRWLRAGWTAWTTGGLWRGRLWRAPRGRSGSAPDGGPAPG